MMIFTIPLGVQDRCWEGLFGRVFGVQISLHKVFGNLGYVNTMILPLWVLIYIRLDRLEFSNFLLWSICLTRGQGGNIFPWPNWRYFFCFDVNLLWHSKSWRLDSTHTIHVYGTFTYIRLTFYGTCRHIEHTWMVRGMLYLKRFG